MKWNRQVQNAIYTVLVCGWLGGLTSDGKPGPVARLLTLEEVGEIFKGMSRLLWNHYGPGDYI